MSAITQAGIDRLRRNPIAKEILVDLIPVVLSVSKTWTSLR